MNLFAFDTETFLIAPGLQAPPMVCLQFDLDGRPQLIHARDPACYRVLRWALEKPDLLWSGHNAAYDFAVICATFPDLTAPVFDLMEHNRAICTIVQMKLIDIALGRFKAVRGRGYNLEVVGQTLRIEHAISKLDPWRVRFGELYSIPVEWWPEDARKYALLDGCAQRAVTLAQWSYAREHKVPLPSVFHETYSAFWIHLMACWGIQVDLQRAQAYIAEVRKGLEVDRETCQAAGLVRENGTKHMEPAYARMVRLCRENGEDDFPLTEGGEKAVRAALQLPAGPLPPGATWAYMALGHELPGVALNEDAVILYGDEELEAFQRYGTATGQIKRAQRLETAGLAGMPIQARFGSLQETGRPSCSQGDTKGDGPPSAYGAQLFNPAKDKEVKRKDGTKWIRKGTREIYVARPGHAFITTDWAGAEASGVAWVCLQLFGFSRLAERINAGANLPTEFGAMIAGISTEEAYALRKAGGEGKKKFDAGPRQSAKIALYGYFANMGPAKLAMQARKQYRVDMSVEDAARYKELLKVFAPELVRYWKWGQDMLDTPLLKRDGSPILDQFGRPKRICSQVTNFLTGMVRGRLTYTELLNNMFQALVATLYKVSGRRLTYEMHCAPTSPLYGCRVVNGPYDDFLTEVPLERLTEAGARQAEVMKSVTRELCPGVDFGVEPAACVRWYKDAEPIYKDGKLVPWEPAKNT